MFINYLKIAIRNLMKNKLFSGLNLMGLALGIAVALLLLVFVKEELSFDRYHSKFDRIYRSLAKIDYGDGEETWANVPNSVGPVMKNEIPGIEAQMRMWEFNYGEKAMINANGQKFSQENFFWADSSMLEIFDLKFLAGDPNTALNGPNKVILSKSVAERYFPGMEAVSQTIKIENSLVLEVTGVYEDFPLNSTLDAAIIGSFPTVGRMFRDLTWDNSSFETYFLLNAKANPRTVEKQMAKVLNKYVPKDRQWQKFALQALKDVHLHSADISDSYTERSGDPQQVRILIILAIVILVIACINYMNLATARAQQRFKEVGITKAVGATRAQLASRFYLETAVLAAFALGIALTLVLLFLPLFNQVSGKQFDFKAILSPQVLLGLLGLWAVVVTLAGAYPAMLLSAFNPKNLLQATFQQNSAGGLLRRSLVIVQFSASIMLMICTVLFYQQLNFIQQQNLGYIPEQVVAINMAGAQDPAQVATFSNACKSIGSVVDVCQAQSFPGAGASGRSVSRPSNLEETFPVSTNHADNNVLKVLGIKLLAGNPAPMVDREPEDTMVKVVVNKLVSDFLGYTPEEAIGKKATNLFGYDRAEIVGVMDNFHFQDLHQPINGYAFHNSTSEQKSYSLIRINSKDRKGSMQQIQKVFDQILPSSAFDYVFLDEHLDTLYRRENRTAMVVLVFSCLSILIACLGLFGLAAFTAERRTKEIGVRKVLGASVSSIVRLLSRDFLGLVLISLVFAAPVAWYFMHNWLKAFAFRIEIQWWVFALAGFLSLLIAFLTVSVQSVRAATANPVESLRSE